MRQTWNYLLKNIQCIFLICKKTGFRQLYIARFIKSEKKEYSLNTERIANEEKYDGFYAIATNLLEDNVKDIIEVNSQRYKIKDCFIILKTNFDARPVYHRLDSRIVVHFKICYTSLLIYRLLEVKLKEKGYHFTINEIIFSLKNMEVYVDTSKYNPTYDYGEILDALNDTPTLFAFLFIKTVENRIISIKGVTLNNLSEF
ncbi:MAG: hypothetical protein ACI35S_01620 [Anaeroplasma sp.]